MTINSTRIVIFTTAFKPFIGGSELAIENIIKRLPDLRFDVVTPRFKKSLKKEECVDNICIHRIGIGSKLDKLLFPVLGFLKAIKISPVLFHTYQASYGGGAGWLYKTFFRNKKFILTLQEGKDLEKQSFLVKFFRRLIIKKADRITAISNYLADYAKKYNKKAEIKVIPNGVDITNFQFKIFNLQKRQELRDSLGIKKDEKVIITVSRLVPKNSVEMLIDAVEDLRFNNKDLRIKLLVIGSGPLEKSLKARVESLKLNSYVLFLGDVAYDKLPDYLALANVFVRVSLSEGLGNAFLEAMAVGVPIIGTSVGGIPDFLKNGKTGLFCKVNDTQDLANKIEMILNNSELKNKLVNNARLLVEEKYNWNKIAQQFKELYEEA